MKPWMPKFVPALHDRVTQNNCAAACAADKLTLAGIDAGNHCFCGATVATAKARERPMGECDLHCHGNTSQLCGGGGRMVVYTYTC